MEVDRATLFKGNGPTSEVADEHQLDALLMELDSFRDGQVIALRRSQSDFIEAIRHGQHWSVTTKRSRMWMVQSFTAEMTSDYSERQVQESREYDSLRQRFMWWWRSPPPERALSTKQVRTLFTEYLLEQKFTLPMSGA